MKEIQPIQMWLNGQFVEGIYLNAGSVTRETSFNFAAVTTVCPWRDGFDARISAPMLKPATKFSLAIIRASVPACERLSLKVA